MLQKNIKKNRNNFKKRSINEISMASFLMGLIILSKQDFLSISFGVMKIGISYSFIILTALILPLKLAIITGILGDTLGLIIKGQIGSWHYIYFFIPFFIILITFSLKNIFKIQNKLYLSLINALIFLIIGITIVVIMILKKDFFKKLKNPNLLIDFSKTWVQNICWVMFGLLSFYNLILSIIFYIKKNIKIKNYLVINIITSTIIVIMIWFYGPTANIIWLNDQSKSKDYWAKFYIFQIPRIIKTPLILPIYNFIILSVYNVYKIKLKNNKNKW